MTGDQPLGYAPRCTRCGRDGHTADECKREIGPPSHMKCRGCDRTVIFQKSGYCPNCGRIARHIGSR